MPVGKIIQQALADGWRIVTNYPKQQVIFLHKPAKFVAGLDFESWAEIKEAFAALLLGGALALLLNKINVTFYDGRIQRVIQFADKTENTVFLVIAVLAFALLTYVPFRLLGKDASLKSTGITLMYAVGYTAPVATLLVIILTRVASEMLDASLVLIPPLKIVQLSYPESTTYSRIVGTVFSGALLAWNIYFSWLLWFALSAANRIGRIYGAVSLIIGVALLYMLGGWIGSAVDRLIDVLRPLLELF
jgi:hypothetical protein